MWAPRHHPPHRRWGRHVIRPAEASRAGHRQHVWAGCDSRSRVVRTHTALFIARFCLGLDLDARAFGCSCLLRHRHPLFSNPSRDFPLVSTDAAGLENRHIIGLYGTLSTKSCFLHSRTDVRSQQPPGLSPPTRYFGQISDDFGRTCGLGEGRICEGRPSGRPVRYVKK